MTALLPSEHAQQLGAHWVGCEQASPAAAFPKTVESSVQVEPPRGSVASCQSGVMFVGVPVHAIGVEEAGADGGAATTCWRGSAGGGHFAQARKAAVDASQWSRRREIMG